MKRNYHYKSVKGFNMNRKSGHPSYVYYQNYYKTKSLGFETNKDKLVDTIKLQHNINPNSNDTCYVKTKVENQKSRDFYNNGKYDKYRIHNDDKKLINSIIENDKKRSSNNTTSMKGHKWRQ